MSLLQSGLSGLVAPANVLLSTAEDFTDFAPQQASVTVFLYHVGISAEMRNTVRRDLASGSLQRPPLPLELRFLITPWTRITRDAYRIIGAVARLFHDRAALTFGELVGDAWAPDDTVEILMESLPVEDHYRIWEPSDIPYRLSLAYLARVVGIDSTLALSGSPVAVATVPSANR